MPIMHDGVQRAPTSLWVAPSPTAAREAGPVSQPQVSPDRGTYERTSTRPSFSAYRFPTPSAPIIRVPVEWLSRVKPTRDRLEGIRAEFESFISARGVRQRDEIFQRLLSADPSEVLAVGLSQYAARGNGDRLLLAADLLASAGERSYDALKFLTANYRPELIYFVDGIATAAELTNAQKEELLVQMAQNARVDSELWERIEAALEWFPLRLRLSIKVRIARELVASVLAKLPPDVENRVQEGRKPKRWPGAARE